MPITAKLSRKLYETFGDEAAADMVDWMNRMDGHRAELREISELSTSRIEARVGQSEATMQARFAQAEATMEARFAQAEATMEARFAQTEATMEARFAQAEATREARFAQAEATMEARFGQMEATIVGRLEAKIEQRTADLMKWSFVFWVGAVAAIAMLAGVLR